MKRFVVSLLSTILAFTAGLVTASSWSWKDKTETHQPVTVNVSPPCAPNLAPPPPPPAPVTSYSVSPAREIEFGQKGLKLVPERVQLKSESLSYDIDVSYPQILGSPYTDTSKIRIVNQHLENAVAKLYQWPMDPERRPDFAIRAATRNTVNFTYHVGLATDSFLSVSFIGYSYDGKNHHQLQDSFSMNYDLTSGRHLKLSEIFKPRSNYLEFISRYSTDELSRNGGRKTVAYALQPRAENFQNWQITANGITFNFYACKVVDCAEGDQMVHISFDDLRPLLNPDVPGKFNITYP